MILDTTANKAINTIKGWNVAVYQKLNVSTEEIVDTEKIQDTVAELLILINDQMTRRMKLEDWIKVG